MPTPAMHLALGEGILRGEALPHLIRRLLIQQRGPFLLGAHRSVDSSQYLTSP